MNHSFIASAWSKTACAKCARTEQVHGNEVQCESCSNIGSVEVVGKILMCAECQARDTNTIPIESISVKEQLSIEQVRIQVDRIVDSNAIQNMNGDSMRSMIDEAIRGNIKEYTDFFNAKIPSINELKESIDNNNTIEPDQKKYALALILRHRIQYLARVLFATKSGQLEMAAEVKVIQEYMGKIIPELRVRLRHEFAQANPNFTPQIIKTTKERGKARSASDKLAESYAKMMKITVDEAKKLLEKKLRNECKCSEMPGICPVHDAAGMVKK